MTNKARVERYVKCLREVGVHAGGDPEQAHSRGDDILCELLMELGYGEVVAAWEGLPKWYA